MFKSQYFLYILICIFLDLLSKHLALTYLNHSTPIEFIPFIDFYLTFNSGIAFGFLDLGSRVMSNMLTFAGILIVAYMLLLLKNENDSTKKLALSIIIGGALGNIFDRLPDGYVTDFLHLKINNFSFGFDRVAARTDSYDGLRSTGQRTYMLRLKTIKSGNKILICGNGGSASDASHIAAEFVGKFERARKPLPAISLSENISSITSIGNDFSFDKIFSKQIQAIGSKDDLLIPISTSGNSENIINAIKASKKIGMRCFALSGNNGGKMSSLTKNIIKVNSKKTTRIQEMHILIGHIICSFIENKI